MTTRLSLRLTTLATAFALALTLTAQQIVLCSKCSYEAAPGANFCTHCGAALPGSSAESSPTENVAALPESSQSAEERPAETPVSDLAVSVSEDIRIAVDFMNAKDGANPAAALTALNNARGIIALAGKEGIPEKDRLAVMNGIVAAKESVSKTRVDCPRCYGKGQEDILHEFATLDGGTTTMASGKRACPRCNGRGWIVKIRKTSEIQSLLGSGRQQYADKALVKGRIKIGNAWIDEDVAKRLKVKEVATLKHFTADPCLECAGFGKTDCKSCDNTGVTTCDAEDCVNGFLRPPRITQANQKEKRLESIKLSTPTPCPRCKGIGLVTCTDCGGTASINCASCNGSGERSLCNKCKGEGITPCRSCKGTGKDKKGQPCPMCSGDGIVPCTTCGGDGYGRK